MPVRFAVSLVLACQCYKTRHLLALVNISELQERETEEYGAINPIQVGFSLCWRVYGLTHDNCQGRILGHHWRHLVL